MASRKGADLGNRTAPRPGETLGKILIGFLLAVLGLPFLGAALIALMMLEGTGRGLVSLVMASGGLWLLAGPQAAAIAALGSCGLFLTLASGRTLADSAAVSAAAMMGGALLFYGSSASVFMLPYGEQGQVWREMMLSMGLTSSEASRVVETTFRILPGAVAAWICAGASLAAVFLARLADSRGIGLPKTGRISLGLGPAWVVIAALAARLLPGVHESLAVWADNVLIFMALPYLLVGFAIGRAALSGFGISPLPFVLLVVLLPQVALVLLVLAGLLDTWFDFRAMIETRIARKRDEGSPD